MPAKQPSPRVKTQPKASRRKGLDRARILEEARKLADRVGASGLSITRLADQLGVTPPSLYAHFAGLPELRRELALRGYRELTQCMIHGGFGLAGEEALFAVCNAYLQWIRESPGLYSAIIALSHLQDPKLKEAAADWIGVLYRALSFYGFNQEELVHASRGLRSIVHGFGSLERGGSFVVPVDRNESFRRMLHSFIKGLRETSATSTRARSRSLI
jgi:AcrR family transcriptional regulator